MAAKLERAGVDGATARATLTELQELSALDDARFARLFVQDKRALEGWGTARILRGLQARGIGRELIEQALTQESQGETELERARALVRRRFSEPPTERGERERALGMLLRKGYEMDVALDALAARGD